MMTPVVLAVTGPDESTAAAAIGSCPHLTVARRCADISEALAVTQAGVGSIVVLSRQPGLDRDAVGQFHAFGVATVGMAVDAEASAHLGSIGIDTIVKDISNSQAWEAAIASTAPVEAVSEAETAEPSQEDGERGSIVAVWGPTGAPGRTTVAVNVAAEFAARRWSSLIVDADTYGGAIATALGLLDEAPGIAALAHAAQRGSLTDATVARHALAVCPDLRVLTGISRPDRWPELQRTVMESVWPVVRQHAAVTVVDCGFGIERDEMLTYDTRAPQRNDATVSALAAADVIVMVGSADPVGVQRMVTALHHVEDLGVMESTQVMVVANRVRSTVMGPSPRAQVADALRRHAGVEEVWTLPYDPKACDAAMMAGQTLVERVPRSALRKALAGLVDHLEGIVRPRVRIHATTAQP